MKLSCGIIFHDKEKFLIGHATGLANWDIPKGGIHTFEYELHCAIREFREETGYDVKPLLTQIKSLGLFRYQMNKNLFLFDLFVPALPPISRFHCNSICLNYKFQLIPEFDKFAYIELKDAEKYVPSLSKILDVIYRGGKF
jgi:8-oxo-dGTP pyrophosphatase MutT (NUDIX family)